MVERSLGNASWGVQWTLCPGAINQLTLETGAGRRARRRGGSGVSWFVVVAIAARRAVFALACLRA
eukprot:6812514-Alexandrium_andersonii.AAC.1